MVPGTAAPRARRVATLIAAATIAAAVGLAGSPAQAQTTTTDPAEAAAGWLANQLVDGERFETEFEGVVYPDQGLTLDAVLAFAAAGVAGEPADAALTWVSREEILGNYLGTEFDSAFAGAYAKLAFAVQVHGLDPTSFGGVDLITELRDLQGANGRFSDASDFGDNSNAFGQSFAILVLEGTVEGAPPEAADFLISEQCPDGGVPLQFGQDTCTGHVDATGMAVQALLAAGEQAAAEAALDWLALQQQPNGGFQDQPGATGALPINANSTGLAAQALRVGGRTEAADQAVAFLRSLQVGCDGPAEQQGAVAFDETGFDPATAVRATTQAALGLAGVPLSDLDGTTAQAGAPALDCEADPDPSPSPEPTPTTPAPGGTGGEKLPVTGSPALGLAGAGVVLAGAGGVLVWLTRLRRREDTPS